MRALVTGTTGFIGLHLVRALLEAGDEVTALVRATSPVERLASLSVRQVVGDVGDADSLRRAVADVDVVYHLAGRIKAWHLADFMQVNADGVRNLVEACAARTTPPVLVSVSSLAAAGPAREGRPLVETDPPRPVSNYGRSKLAGERILAEFAGRLPITIVRPPMVFGPGDPGMLVVFRTVRRQRLMLVPIFHTVRFSMVEAGDLSRLLRTAAERGARITGTDDPQVPGVYFLSHEQRPSYQELGRLVADAMGCSRPFNLPTPARGAYLVGLAGEVVNRLRGEPGFFSLDKVREAVAGSWICSAERAERELAYRPAAPLAEQLGRTAEDYRQRGWL